MRFSVVRYDLLFVIRLFWLFQFFSIFLRDQLEEGGGGGKGWRKYRDVCYVLFKGFFIINQEKDNSKDCFYFFSIKYS